MRTARTLVGVIALLTLAGAVPSARAGWTVPLPAPVPGTPLPPGMVPSGEPRGATPCSTTEPLPFFAPGTSWTWDTDGNTRVPADYPSGQGTIAPGSIVYPAWVWDLPGFTRHRLHSDGPEMTIERARLCTITWPAPAAEAAIAGVPIPNVRIVGGTAPVEQSAPVLRRLGQVPEVVRRRFDERGGIGILTLSDRITQVQGWENRAGLDCTTPVETIPRTCDDIAGQGGSSLFPTTPMFIARLQDDMRASAGGVALHEFGHAVDRAFGATATARATDEQAWSAGPFAEAMVCVPTNAYLNQQPREWFAESFAIMYAAPQHQAWLQTNCPKTWTYFRDRFGFGTFDSRVPIVRWLPQQPESMMTRPSISTARVPGGRLRVTASFARAPDRYRISAQVRRGDRQYSLRSWPATRRRTAGVLRVPAAGTPISVCVRSVDRSRGSQALWTPWYCRRTRA